MCKLRNLIIRLTQILRQLTQTHNLLIKPIMLPLISSSLTHTNFTLLQRSRLRSERSSLTPAPVAPCSLPVGFKTLLSGLSAPVVAEGVKNGLAAGSAPFSSRSQHPPASYHTNAALACRVRRSRRPGPRSRPHVPHDLGNIHLHRLFEQKPEKLHSGLAIAVAQKQIRTAAGQSNRKLSQPSNVWPHRVEAV